MTQHHTTSQPVAVSRSSPPRAHRVILNHKGFSTPTPPSRRRVLHRHSQSLTTTTPPTLTPPYSPFSTFSSSNTSASCPSTPPRGKASLAMSIPIHAPIAASPSFFASHQPSSRPSSPFHRPPSRSERLLRDTLLRDELERRQPPPPPLPSPRRRQASPPPRTADHYHTHNYYSYSNDKEREEDEEQEDWPSRTSALFRTSTTPSRSPPNLVRNKSTSHVVNIQDMYRNSSSSSSSPPPSPTRSTTRHHHHSPPSLHRSPNSISEGMSMRVGTNIIPTTSTITSKSQRRRSTRSSSSISIASSPPLHRSTSPSPPSGSHPGLLTPHEQVLKARLERVLGDVAGEDWRRGSLDRERDREGKKEERRGKRGSLDGEVGLRRKRNSGSGESKKSIIDEGDPWKWGQLHDSPISSEGSSETSTRPSPHTPPQTLHHHHAPHTPPPTHSLPLLTPPQYPPNNNNNPQPPSFNARKASARCRQMEGYVSFASVEGLGEPPAGVDDDHECDQDKAVTGGGLAHGLKNLKLWRVWPFVGEAGEQEAHQ